MARALCRFHRSQRARSGLRQCRTHLPVGTHRGENAPVGIVIVHDKNRKALECLPLEPGSVEWGCHGMLKGCGELKYAAASDFALHPHASTHHFHDSARNGQAQARSAEPARGGPVRLRESFENRFLFFAWYSDSLVQNTDVPVATL